MLGNETSVTLFGQAIGNIVLLHQTQEKGIEGGVIARFIPEGMVIPNRLEAIIGQNPFGFLGGAVFQYEADGFGQPFGFQHHVIS